jgi:hypothetical protein
MVTFSSTTCWLIVNSTISLITIGWILGFVVTTSITCLAIVVVYDVDNRAL